MPLGNNYFPYVPEVPDFTYKTYYFSNMFYIIKIFFNKNIFILKYFLNILNFKWLYKNFKRTFNNFFKRVYSPKVLYTLSQKLIQSILKRSLKEPLTSSKKYLKNILKQPIFYEKTLLTVLNTTYILKRPRLIHLKGLKVVVSHSILPLRLNNHLSGRGNNHRGCRA